MRERGEAARGNFPPPEKKLVEDRKALKPKLQARAQVRRTAATHRIKVSRYVRPTNIIVPAPFLPFAPAESPTQRTKLHGQKLNRVEVHATFEKQYYPAVQTNARIFSRLSRFSCAFFNQFQCLLSSSTPGGRHQGTICDLDGAKGHVSAAPTPRRDAPLKGITVLTQQRAYERTA